MTDRKNRADIGRWLAWGLVLCLIVLPVPRAAADPQQPLPDDVLENDPGVKSQVGKTGEYRINAKAVPYRLYLETADLFGALKDRNDARARGKKFKWMTPDKGQGDFTYEVWAPERYDPATPAGLLVFINAGDTGRFRPQYREQLAARNLVVIGANKSGNKVDTILRLMHAYYGVELMKRRYKIDPNRVYITGGSGGGRAASHAMFFRPEVFQGGCPMIGSSTPIADMNQAFRLGTPPMHAMPSKKAMQLAKTRRYAFLTGEKDYNRKECVATAKYLDSIGFKHVTSMVQPGLGHNASSPEYLGKALAFLDAPLIKQAASVYNAAHKDLARGRLESALNDFETAGPYLALSDDPEIKSKAQDAKAQAALLIKQYGEAVAALDQAIADKDAKAAQALLRDLQRQWKNRLGREAANGYRKQVREAQRG